MKILSSRQACGPLHFGMIGAQLQKAGAQLRGPNHGAITAEMLRRGLLVNGTKYPAQLAERDATIRLATYFPSGHPLREITFQSQVFSPATEYNSVVKAAWETLRDIGDSKFMRKAKKAEFPRIEFIDTGGKLFVTDNWEANGARVEVGIAGRVLYGEPGVKYGAVLKLKDLLSPATGE